LGVSCMGGDSRIDQAAESFDAARLVHLALSPLLQHLPQAAAAEHLALSVPVMPAMPEPRAQVEHLPSQARNKTAQAEVAAPKLGQCLLDDDIEIPTLMGALASTPARKKAANVSRVLKVAHG